MYPLGLFEVVTSGIGTVTSIIEVQMGHVYPQDVAKNPNVTFKLFKLKPEATPQSWSLYDCVHQSEGPHLTQSLALHVRFSHG